MFARISRRCRDHGSGVFIHDPNLSTNDGLNGPVIGNTDPTNSAGGDFAPIMIERFTRVTNSTLFIYYTLSTWNPYTVVKMRSAFTIAPAINVGSAAYSESGFTCSWSAPTNESFPVQFSNGLPPVWTTLTNLLTSTNGSFNFTDDGSRTGGLGKTRFYRLRTGQP